MPIAERARMTTIRSRLLAITIALAACSDEEPRGPITDCEVESGGTLSCPHTFPGCTFSPDVAVQFERCGHRHEYVVYGRAEGCPEIYYYPEGSFLSSEDWAAYVGACERVGDPR